VRLLDAPLWERQGLGIAAYHEVARGARRGASLHRLREVAIEEQLRAVGAAVRHCERFLAGRQTGSQRLASHPAVAHNLARLIADAAALTSANFTAGLRAPAGRAWLTAEIDAVVAQAIKLAGGRSLLAGQAVQLRMLLLTFNRLYLEG
jgi:hypothetical protein